MYDIPMLEDIAQAYTGKAVTVWTMPTYADCGAAADYRNGYRIGLHPHMCHEGAKALAKAFLHELGHVALGHVHAANPPEGAISLPDAEAMLDAKPDDTFAASMKAHFEKNDREADAWAAKRLPGLEDVCKANDTELLYIFMAKSPAVTR